jgi:hypothetical protein
MNHLRSRVEQLTKLIESFELVRRHAALRHDLASEAAVKRLHDLAPTAVHAVQEKAEVIQTL